MNFDELLSIAEAKGKESSLMIKFTETQSSKSSVESTLRVGQEDPPARAEIEFQTPQEIYCGRGVPKYKHLNIIKHRKLASRYEYENWEIYFSKQELAQNKIHKV